MKVCEQKNEVTLQVHGREMTFTEQELIAIVQEHLSSETTVAQKPTEGEWFEVKPQAIDQKLFEKKREDAEQEETRQRILEAFDKMKENPEKYGKNFKTMMPKKTWNFKSGGDLTEMAEILGDRTADWVEQALEWAQQIANGESWEAICNDKDTANWYRLFIWKDGNLRLIGGSVFAKNYPASFVHRNFCHASDYLYCTVPLVVFYE